jgi:hypothetical protein
MNTSIELERQWNGQCVECGVQTHELQINPSGNMVIKIPLSIEGEVHRGRCLMCHPLPQIYQALARPTPPSQHLQYGAMNDNLYDEINTGNQGLHLQHLAPVDWGGRYNGQLQLQNRHTGPVTSLANQMQLHQQSQLDGRHAPDFGMERNNRVENIIIPLQAWVESEDYKAHSPFLDLQARLIAQRAGVLRKLSVAFALGKLLEHLKDSVSSYSQDELMRYCSVDNFSVHILPDGADEEGWEVVGLDMVSPPMSLKLTSNGFDSSNVFQDSSYSGRDLTAFITLHSPFCCAKRLTYGPD